MTDYEINAQKKALTLFHEVYETSKAYRAFIDSHHINVKDIKDINDFQKIPIMDRYNYINKYPLEDRLYGNRKLEDSYMISASSGSTGEATFWARDLMIDTYIEKVREKLYIEHFEIDTKKTLLVNAFALGSWTGGMLETKFAWSCSSKYKFTVVTPGMDKINVLSFIKKLYKFYDQVIILAYPPFLTDFIDYAKQHNFSLKKAHVKINCTGERFSEKWRNHMVHNINDSKNRHDVIGFYACSDTGIIGWETKKTINVLEKASNNPRLNLQLFGNTDTPTFMTYDPQAKYLECVNNEILITARQPIPLIRYNIHDRGGLINTELMKRFNSQLKLNNDDKEINNHNFVYVFGRSDAILLAANIYIEDIKYCLENSRYYHKLTGNFKFGREETSDLRYRMRLIVLLKQKANITLEERKIFKEEFYQHLRKVNNDFKLIQDSTKMKKILFEFKEDDPHRFRATKLKYFI
ncbi:MAG: hypothetical protein Q7R95_05195 [bacterium]|nr:hypothetical protein [bacterium]